MTALLGEPVPRGLRPTATHRILMQLGFRAIITTNYDRLLEAALGSADVISLSYSDPGLQQIIQDGHKFILHLHGDLMHPGDIILSEEDYDGLLTNPGCKDALQILLSGATPLWLGYGHGPGDVDLAVAKALIRAYRLHGGVQPVLASDTCLQGRLQRHQITPIPISSYGQIPELLCDLAKLAGRQLHLTVCLNLPVTGYQEMESKEQQLSGAIRSMGYKPSDVAAGLETSGEVIFMALNALGRNVTDHFLLKSGLRLPEQLDDPTLRIQADVLTTPLDDLFSTWSKNPAGAAGRCLAISALAGAGKTVLLLRYASWLRDRACAGDAAGFFAPVVLFITPDLIPESSSGPITAEVLWASLQRRAVAVKAGYYALNEAGILEPFRQARRVYLLFDGLDKFGARRREELPILMQAFRQLANDKGVHVVLTCRQAIWDNQISDKEGWVQVGIDPLSEARIQRLLSGAGGEQSPAPLRLGRFAYDEHGRPKLGVFNPLVVHFLRELLSSPREPVEFRTRSELFTAWAENAAKHAERDTGVPTSTWLEAFRQIAFDLLRREDFTVPPPLLGAAPDSGAPAMGFYEYLSTDVLLPSAKGQEVKFVHDSVEEFFTVWALEENFRRAASFPPAPASLFGLRLANVNLDFYQTSVYGFLYDRLGSKYIDSLLEALQHTELAEWNVLLLRNLIEYVGMTYSPESNEPSVPGQTIPEPRLREIVRWLITVIRESGLDHEIRYNAARALERLHPWAPRPYFDYMSDWGGADWSDRRRNAKLAGIRPSAIRGYRAAASTGRRHPGDYPPISVWPEISLDDELQREASSELIQILEELLAGWAAATADPGQPGCDRVEVDWLLINCSYALVRWYHGDHGDELSILRRHARERQVNSRVLKNLEEWVGHPLCLYPKVKFPLVSIRRRNRNSPRNAVVVLRVEPGAAIPVLSVQSQWNRGRGIIRGAKDASTSELLEDHACERIDPARGLVPSTYPIVGAEDLREGVWTVEDHLANYQAASPGMEVIGWVGNGNLLNNPHFVGFTRLGGRPWLFRLRNEERHLGIGPTSRRYSCLVAWRSIDKQTRARLSIETLQFALDDEAPQVFSTKENRLVTEEVEFATFGQQVVADGRPIDRATLSTLVAGEQFYDLRHIFLFGRLSCGESRWIDIGLSAFWDGRGNLEQETLKRALRGLPISVDVSQFREEDAIRALVEKDYEPCPSPLQLQRGQFNMHGGTLSLVLQDGVYPHNLIGLTADGTLLSVIVTGQSNREGATIIGAGEIMAALGARDALLLDNGGDVMLGYGTVRVPEPGHGSRDRLRAMILFSQPAHRQPDLGCSLLCFPRELHSG